MTFLHVYLYTHRGPQFIVSSNGLVCTIHCRVCTEFDSGEISGQAKIHLGTMLKQQQVLYCLLICATECVPLTVCVCVCVTVCACVCICFRCSDKIESRSWGVHSLLQILARRITKGIHSASLNCPIDWFQVAVFFLGLRLGQSTYAKPCECDCPSTALLEEFKHVLYNWQSCSCTVILTWQI